MKKYINTGINKAAIKCFFMLLIFKIGVEIIIKNKFTHAIKITAL